jgi:hypothetical protein
MQTTMAVAAVGQGLAGVKDPLTFDRFKIPFGKAPQPEAARPSTAPPSLQETPEQRKDRLTNEGAMVTAGWFQHFGTQIERRTRKLTPEEKAYLRGERDWMT